MQYPLKLSEIPYTEPTPVDNPPAEEGPVGIYSSSGGSSEIKFGSLTIQLKQGDLVQQNTDAIVNTVGRDLSLKGNIISSYFYNVLTTKCNK